MLIPLISIIVPCYNQAQYLDECLQSVFDQTYHNWECIIINDGSTDHTEEVAKEWIQKDPRFQYIDQENRGVSAARNNGINHAAGDWILPLDGDDKIGTHYLEKAKEYFDKNFTLIYCKAEFFGNTTGEFRLPEYNFKKILLHNQIFCSAFFRKDTWIAAGGYDESLLHGLEDWDFWISVLENSSQVYKLDYVGFFYRRKTHSRDTAINANADHKNSVKHHIYQKHYKKYTNEYPGFFDLMNKISILERENARLLYLVNESIFRKVLRKLF